MIRLRMLLPVCALLVASTSLAQNDDFVNFESAHVHPLELTPDGSTLLAVNTAAARLEVFDVDPANGFLTRRGSVRVGLDPVTVRAVTDDIAWVVCQISDSISVVNVSTLSLLDSLRTPDEPCDVVFTGLNAAGDQGTAWVSCAQPAEIARFDMANLDNPPTVDSIFGKDPTAMAVSPDGETVYVALRSSGNRTTVLAGGQGMMPNAVSHPNSPYQGRNPPPNNPSGTTPITEWEPNLNPALVNNLLEAALIVRQPDENGDWVDDNGEIWTEHVSGIYAPGLGRVSGWGMADHDLAIIDATQPTFTVTFARDCMNIVAGIAIQPLGSAHGVSLIGTEAINEVRFEPNLKGIFTRAVNAVVNPGTASRLFPVSDLNPDIVYSTTATMTQDERDDSIGDPRAQVFSASGLSTWIAGMGSNNVVRYDFATGMRTPIDVGSGPTGLAINAAENRIYVLNKFEGSVSVLDDANALRDTTPFFDPTPLAVKRGRKHLYDTHRTSGFGQAACASCHVDARMDGLAWDLGKPEGDFHYVGEYNTQFEYVFTLTRELSEFHPMKGPMTTQTLQDIVGKEPFHWRGDKRGIEEFNAAYEGLQGDDAQLTAAEMQEFEDFLASIYMPPNPYRLVTNELPATMDLTPFGISEFLTTPGLPTPLTSGDAQAGLVTYRSGQLTFPFSCVSCHTLPVGIGTDHVWSIPSAPGVWTQMPAGEYGNAHSAMQLIDEPNPQSPMKIAQLRNMHEKTGFDMSSTQSLAGFGYLHDGSVDTLGRFMSNTSAFLIGLAPNPNEIVSDLTALMLAFSGTRMPQPMPNMAGQFVDVLEPPGIPGQNVHAGIGLAVTLDSLAPADLPEVYAAFGNLTATHDAAVASGDNDIALIVLQNIAGGGQRGYRYAGNWMFDEDDGSQETLVNLFTSIGPGTELTLMMVPFSERTRLGVDTDADMVFDEVERNAGSDPEDRLSFLACTSAIPASPSGVVATAPGQHAVNVTWTDNASDEDGFIIERAWNNSLQFEIVGIVRSANAQQFTDSSVGVNTEYVYRVRAYNCAGRSAPSAVSAFVTSSDFLSPAVVHVSEIDFLEEPAATPGGPDFWGMVHVVDDQDRPFGGVDVTVLFTGGQTQTRVTNGEGQAVFNVPVSSLPGGAQTVTVTAITGGPPGTSYDASANFITTFVYPP